MIVAYNSMPSTRFIERVRAALVFDDDCTYLSECVDAKNRAGQLVAYMKQCAAEDTYPDANVLAYIMTGKDFDGFNREVCKEKKN